MGEGVLAGQRVAVIGAGMIGGTLVARLRSTGARTKVLSRSGPVDPEPNDGAVAFFLGDAADPTLVAGILAGVDHVVYCAGTLLPGGITPDAAEEVRRELAPLRVVLDLLSDAGRPTFTYLSSGGTVYGQSRYLPIDEDHPTHPCSPYGWAKLRGERLVLSASHRDGFSVRILRCGNVFGSRQRTDRSHGAVGVFLGRIMRGEPIRLFGDGSAIRDFVHVDDVVDAIIELLRVRDGETTVNVGSGIGTSLRELVRMLEEETGRHALIDSQAPRGFDVLANVLDVGRLERLIGYRPAPLRVGLGRLLREPAVSGARRPA